MLKFGLLSGLGDNAIIMATSYSHVIEERIYRSLCSNNILGPRPYRFDGWKDHPFATFQSYHCKRSNISFTLTSLSAFLK
jgi:hypothetical protein